MQKIRILVVDDSLFIRKSLIKLLTTDDTEVIDTAGNGKEAVEKTLALNPDVVTMDIEMPVMNGMDALKEIMSTKPVPVLILSKTSTESSDNTIEALSIGAVDFIAKKPGTDMISMTEELLHKIRTIARDNSIINKLKRRSSDDAERLILPEGGLAKNLTQVLALQNRSRKKKFTSLSGRHRPQVEDIKIIGIGISTGGPDALLKVIPRLPKGIPVPITVVQHMPAQFTKSLADRLNSLSALNVIEARDGGRLAAGTVYIAPGGQQMTINKYYRIDISDEPLDALYKPSVSVMFNSLVNAFGNSVVGYMMTGMGSDGLDAFKKLHTCGGYVLAQEPDTCIVAGMPKAVIDAGIADEIVPLELIADSIASLFGLEASIAEDSVK